VLFPFVYQAAAIVCLRHWGSSAPWQDVDFFSGGFVGVTLLFQLYEAKFKRGMLRSPETIRELAGLTYDRATVGWGSILTLGELAVFLDYGHWHLTLELRRPVVQSAGLLLYVLAVAGLMWTDTCLVRNFQGDLKDRQLMTTGPFAIVRHPRYAGLLLSKLGFALTFASIFAWFSLLASIILIRRRIRLEETHLQEIFGPSYSDYMQRTPGLFPRSVVEYLRQQ
jgi:protein-S-isoprenylcysteine O-methyltransferase Ste14